MDDFERWMTATFQPGRQHLLSPLRFVLVQPLLGTLELTAEQALLLSDWLRQIAGAEPREEG